jgi:hypothetical protein
LGTVATGHSTSIRSYRELVPILVAGVGAVGYASLTPPAAGREVFSWLPDVAALAGDLPDYIWRFLVSFVLLGVIPLAGAILAGERPGELGLRRPGRVAPVWVWILVAVAAVAVAVTGAYAPGTSTYYPYSKTLLERVASGGYGFFALHVVLYLVLYYLPWELLFRGLLVFPVIRLAGAAPRSALICLASVQAIPSALLHVGHPPLESLGAVGFGVAAGYLAVRSGSILPGFAIHAGIGVLQDVVLMLRSIGVLP